MKTMRNYFLLCAGLSLFACSSDDDATQQFPEGKGAVTIKIVPPQSRAISAATSDGQVVNGDITLTLSHDADKTIEATLTYDEENGTYSLSGTEQTLSTDDGIKVTFYNVVSPTGLTATMNGGLPNYDDTNIASDGTNSSPNMQATPEKIPAYGSVDASQIRKSGEVINNNGTDYVEYEANIEMTIPVARLEVQIGVGTLTGFNSVILAGTYLDNILPTPNGSATDYYLKFDNSATKKATGDGDAAYAILCDNYMTSEATTGNDAITLTSGSSQKLPNIENIFAYNFYPSNTDSPKFKLCLKVEGSDQSNPIPSIQYAIINKFIDTTTSSEVTFEKGMIYKVTNLTLNHDNIQVDESGEELAYALTATVTQASWNVVTTVNGSWAQGTNPVLADF